MVNRKHSSIALLLAASALVSACHGGDKAPKGQVVATVYGQEITERALQAEMGKMPPQDEATRQKMRDAVLKKMVERAVLAHEAEARKLDKTPEYALESAAVTQQVKASLLQKSLLDQVPKPTPEEIQKFVADHPNQFANRKIYVVDQVMTLVADEKATPELAKETSFDALLAKLQERRAPMQRSLTTIDPLRVDPRATDKLATMSPGDIFIINDAHRMMINHLVQVQPSPVTGDAANNLAARFLSQQRQQEAVSRQVKTMLDKAADEIHYKTPAKKEG